MSPQQDVSVRDLLAAGPAVSAICTPPDAVVPPDDEQGDAAERRRRQRQKEERNRDREPDGADTR